MVVTGIIAVEKNGNAWDAGASGNNILVKDKEESQKLIKYLLIVLIIKIISVY